MSDVFICFLLPYSMKINFSLPLLGLQALAAVDLNSVLCACTASVLTLGAHLHSPHPVPSKER